MPHPPIRKCLLGWIFPSPRGRGVPLAGGGVRSDRHVAHFFPFHLSLPRESLPSPFRGRVAPQRGEGSADGKAGAHAIPSHSVQLLPPLLAGEVYRPPAAGCGLLSTQHSALASMKPWTSRPSNHQKENGFFAPAQNNPLEAPLPCHSERQRSIRPSLLSLHSSLLTPRLCVLRALCGSTVLSSSLRRSPRLHASAVLSSPFPLRPSPFSLRPWRPWRPWRFNSSLLTTDD